jgi:Domain of unknown function (DUF4157)/OmpA family
MENTRVAPPLVHNVLRSPGRPLDAAMRAALEPQFGHDFSQIRVHTDEAAARSAHKLDALAYAAGPHIVFAQSQYSPESSSGRRLLAHELAHTVQQSNAAPHSGLPIGEPHTAGEAEATHAADAVSTGRSISVSSQSGPMVSRQPANAPSIPDNHTQVKQALTAFLEQVKKAFPNQPLAKMERVQIAILNLAAASKPKTRIPEREVSAREIKDKVEQFLNSPTAPAQPADLAEAVVQLLPGPVGQAAIDQLNRQGVFKPSEPKGLEGVVDRYKKLEPGKIAEDQSQAAVEQKRREYAEGKESTAPKMSPGIDIPRTYGAIAGGRKSQDAPSAGAARSDPAALADWCGSTVSDYRYQMPPLMPAYTTDLFIHFKQGQPVAVVADEQALGATLSPGARADLDRVIAWLTRGPEFSVQLTGKASAEGPSDHNRQLGENRVRSIASALMRSGISASRIDDAPGHTEACSAVSIGMYNCGDSGAAKPFNAEDRQVRARLFAQPKGPGQQ